MGGMGDIERPNAICASLALAREEAAWRLRLLSRLDQMLEFVGQCAVFEVGFSSLGVCAVQHGEHGERTMRWAEGPGRCPAAVNLHARAPPTATASTIRTAEQRYRLNCHSPARSLGVRKRESAGRLAAARRRGIHANSRGWSVEVAMAHSG